MKEEKKGTFTSLERESNLFKEIKKQNPQWWSLLCNDTDLYIEVRKDNYINVYYYGGSLAKISYKNGFVAEIHQKYLGDSLPRGKNKKGKDIFDYDLIDIDAFDINKISEIKRHIYLNYLEQINDEKPAEKWIQGKMIKENSGFIDSEFQFNQDSEIGKLRIDLVELKNDILTFVELKGIFDNRLRNDAKRNSNEPEIIEQMKKYNMFINKYEEKIITYYQTLIDIKNDLGLLKIERKNIKLNKTPRLIIANTYNKKTIKRDNRIADIEKLLKIKNIDFEIVEWK